MVRIIAILAILVATPALGQEVRGPVDVNQPGQILLAQSGNNASLVSFETTADLVTAIGKDVPRDGFAALARYFDLPPLRDDHSVKMMELDWGNGEFKVYVVRRFQDGREPDIIFASGNRAAGYFFLVSIDGDLLNAGFKTSGTPLKQAEEAEARPIFEDDVRKWRRWATDNIPHM